MTTNKIPFVETLRGEKAGFSFGKPQRLDQDSLAIVLPILSKTDAPRKYITFPETDKVLVFDTGIIDSMEVDNPTDDAVFIRSGTLFTGATQSRALQQSTVVFPKQKTKVRVRCVHASHGINSSTKVKYGGVTPMNFDQKVYDAGYTPKDQSSYWSSATASNVVMCCMARGQSAENTPIEATTAGGTPQTHWFRAPGPGMDDLCSNFNKFATTFEHLLAKVKRLKNQAGLALITDAGVQTIEVFEHPASWTALHDAAVKRLGPELARKDNKSVFEYKPAAAVKLVDNVLALPFVLNTIAKFALEKPALEFEVAGMTADGYVGEITTINQNVIHMVILKRAA